MRGRTLEVSEGDSQRNVFNGSRKKEETRQGMALNGHLEINRREENGERENDSMQGRTGEGDDELNLHSTGQRSEEEC
uniref:Uncharacterized protein n=1 Tax=Trichobilharzia regenti TaxID=157069 RepID=A0AA85JPX1_TRIRE|nr:unnamed protein product [Trichobilharzia regenti]